MHTSRAINAVVIYDSAALDFSTVYKKYFTKVKQRLVQLDYKSGFTRRGDQYEDLTQAFFTKVRKNVRFIYYLNHRSLKWHAPS